MEVPSIQDITPHDTVTARRGLNYEFTPKHHGADSEASCWQTEIELEEEFAIFDRADGIVVEQIGGDDQQVADGCGGVILKTVRRIYGETKSSDAKAPVCIIGQLLCI
jgi:hypothetical protein